MQSLQMIGNAYQIPFPFCLFKASEHKQPKAHNVFDKPKDRFNRTFSFAVDLFAFLVFWGGIVATAGIASFGGKIVYFILSDIYIYFFKTSGIAMLPSAF